MQRRVMRAAMQRGLASLMMAGSACAQLPIPYHALDIVDAASNSDGIAAGGLFIVKGFFPAPVVIARPPLAKAINGYSVTLTRADGGGTPVEAWMLYTHYAQMAALLPSTTAPGLYEVSVTTPTQTLKSTRQARVLTRKFRSFSNNQEGWGLAAAQNFVSAGRVDRNMFVAGRLTDGQTKGPAAPGQTIILWGTGLGPIAQRDEAAPSRPIDLRDSATIEVSVGGIPATVTYAGRSPEFPGVDQVQFVLPSNALTGCNVVLGVVVNGQPSNPVTLAVAPRGAAACEHAYFAAESLEAFDQGAAMGPGQMDRFVAGEFTLQAGSYGINYQGVATNANFSMMQGSYRLWSATEVSRPGLTSIAPGACVSWQGDPDQRLFLTGIADDSADAGEVSLTRPGGPTLALNGDDDYYFRMMGVVLDDGRILIGPDNYPVVPGNYILRGAGGSDLAAFEASLQVPSLLRWTNRDTTAALDIAQGVTVTWSGGNVTDRVFVQGGGTTYASTRQDTLVVTGFVCAAPPGATSFTVPPSALRGLTPVANGMIEVTAFSGAPAMFRTPIAKAERSVATTFQYQMTRRRELPFR